MEAEYLIKVGESIKKHRMSKQHTLASLGVLCGIDRQQMSKIEKGKMNITMITLKKISKALKVRPSDLLDF